jgi:hypothetical protein
MTPTALSGAHPDDGALLRLLDGEAADAERHVASCAACRERLGTLRRRASRLGATLGRADFPVPASLPPLASADSGTRIGSDRPIPLDELLAPLAFDDDEVDASNDADASNAPARASKPVDADSSESKSADAVSVDATSSAKVIPMRRTARRAEAGRPWLRAAAIVLLVLGVGVLATPARAWVAALVAELFGGGDPAPVETPAPAPAVESAPETQAASRVEFVPAGSTFSIDVANAQAAGGLTLQRAAGETAVAEIVGAGSADFLVLPSGLRIQNAAGASAEYRVSVPAGVRRVPVRVGGREMATVDVREIGPEGRRIGL